MAWLAGRLADADAADMLWIGDTAPPGVDATPARTACHQLGRGFGLLVFDAHAGFHPDAFAAAVGTLRGGGDCVVLTPRLERWPEFEDPDSARFAPWPLSANDMRPLFLERLQRLWGNDPAVVRVDAGSDLGPRFAPAASTEPVLSSAQETAVEAVMRVATGHARRPLVLTADRGRGKSTVLGVAAARLLQQGYPVITVIAARAAAAETLFQHARRLLGDPGGIAGPRFALPHDWLAQDPNPPGLLLVDEAASIPLPVLGRLLERGNRLVFASTVHGYEGSGRGFDLRFRALLDRRMPQWRSLQLQPPVRWAEDDPLESLVHRSLVLDADSGDAAGPGDTTFSTVPAARLAADEALLREVFGLLVDAHYQTRPSDLRQLLDNPRLAVCIAQRNGRVVGVLLVSREGGFDAAMATEILAGRRRPRGHLLPQSLAVHAGLDEALRLSTWRIQRIAVHPRQQREGIGRGLVTALASEAKDADLLGCAFGVDEGLLAFWERLGFVPARLGSRVDAASAAHSLFMVRGLGPVGRTFAATAQLRLQRDLPWAVGAELADVPAAVVARLLAGRDCRDLDLDADDRRALARLASGARPLAGAGALLWRAVVHVAAAARLSADELSPVLAWCLQHHPLESIVREYPVTGRRDLEARVRRLLHRHGFAVLSGG